MEHSRRRYLQFDVAQAYPAGKGLYYECRVCGDIIPSLPDENMACSCENIAIDVDYGRVHVDNPSQLLLFLLTVDGGGSDRM